jgi:hypothetical protein
VDALGDLAALAQVVPARAGVVALQTLDELPLARVQV